MSDLDADNSGETAAGAAGSTTRDGGGAEDVPGELNESLDDVIILLEREIERLKASLETYRLSEHPQRAEIVRWHVRGLDERQDALDRVKALILEARSDKRLH